MKITYHLAASRDGFIAKPDGDVSWLNEFSIDPAESGLDQFFNSIDGLVMGRRTYEFLLDYGAWPYEDRPAWVCTRSKLERIPGANLNLADRIDDVMQEAVASGLTHLWLVGGGQLASSFLERGWITDICVTELPIELGDGIPIFAGHDWNSIPCRKKDCVQKTGFRQIAIQLPGPSV